MRNAGRMTQMPRRYQVTSQSVSRAHAIACSDWTSCSLSQVALIGTLAILILLSACGGKSSANGGLDPVVPGSVNVTVTGLPSGTPAALTLTGPNGYKKSVVGDETISGLTPGSYTLSAAEADVDGDGFHGTPEAQTVVVRSAAASSGAVAYAAATGRLTVTINGLSSGGAAVQVAGPGGFVKTVTATETLKKLAPGSYALSASAVVVDGDRYTPAQANQAAAVEIGGSGPSVAFDYALVSGRLQLSIAGAPTGTTPVVSITGPNGFAQTTTEGQLYKGLEPGSYAIAAPNVASGGHSYQPTYAPGPAVLVGPSPVAASASVTYAISTGALTVTVGGLPSGTNAPITVTGPSYSHTVTATETMVGLTPGTYTVASANVTVGPSIYVPSASVQTITVSAGTTPVNATVQYTVGAGNLDVSVVGLPNGVGASVTVTGPNGFSQALTGSVTLGGLAPGNYTIVAAPVSASGQTYNPSPSTQSKTVSIGTTSTATVAYAGTLGNLTVTIMGLPGGVNAGVVVTGPSGFTRNVTATQTLTGLAAGSYVITANNVVSGPTTYSGSPGSQSAAVTAGATVSKSVAYTASGSLTVTVSGLPGGAIAAIVVTGPAAYNQSVTATTTLSGLTPGSFTVTASNVASGGSTYGPTPGSQTINVTSGATATVTVVYAVLPVSGLNLQIDGMYLTQAAAKYDGTTPVISGRDAYLRVFVKASQANTAAPTVRVRLYSGAALIQTSTIPAPSGSVPTTITEGTFASSWNLAVPAPLVQPNLKILADVDPTNTVAESSESDNNFPTNATPFAIDVKTVPTWNVRFVPILQQANGLQGNVTAGNMASFLVDPLKMLPIATYAPDVRAAYTTTAPAVDANNTNGAWGTILNEIWALRTSDASTRYYYGVIKTSYGGGVAGMGYVGGGVNASIGWDALPSGSGIMAHEVGHNMGRAHSPCGGAASPDPLYPYAGGQIGTYGLDLSTLTVKQPTTNFDFMGYCNPDWVSDYTWSKLITYRQSNPNYGPGANPSSANAGSGLLVWGRMTHAGVILEPAFKVTAPTTAPSGDGSYRVEGLAADGSILFSTPIAPVHTMTAGVQTGHDQHFAVVLPITSAQEQTLTRLRLVTPQGAAERLSGQAAAPGGAALFRRPDAVVSKPNAGQAVLRWDGTSYPMALVRDPATGQILSFARGGTATIWATGSQFDVTFSDGVRSTRQVVK